MKPSDFQKTTQCQFESLLKKVTRGIVANYRKELSRRQNKEVSFCELPEKKRNILLMFYFLEMSDTEIGDLLNITRRSSHRNRTSSLDEIKKIFEEEK